MSYPRLFSTPGIGALAEELDAERARQLAKFGDQHHPDGTGNDATIGGMNMIHLANMLKDLNNRRRVHHYPLIPAGWSAAGVNDDDNGPHWLPILLEEVFEAGAETDPAKLRTELIQVAAVCAAWISDIDRRGICARCHGHGRIPDLSKPLNADFGEPEAKPCPDCQTKDHR